MVWEQVAPRERIVSCLLPEKGTCLAAVQGACVYGVCGLVIRSPQLRSSLLERVAAVGSRLYRRRVSMTRRAMLVALGRVGDGKNSKCQLQMPCHPFPTVASPPLARRRAIPDECSPICAPSVPARTAQQHLSHTLHRTLYSTVL